MFHSPSYTFTSANFNKKFLEEQTKANKQDMQLCRNIFEKNTEIPKELLDLAFKEEKNVYLTEKQCIKYKVATNYFNTWSELYKREKILEDEVINTFDITINRE